MIEERTLEGIALVGPPAQFPCLLEGSPRLVEPAPGLIGPGHVDREVGITGVGRPGPTQFGEGLIDTAPGSVHGLKIVIDDADAAYAELSGRGVPVSEVQELSWGRFVNFDDPDGNAWALQQLPQRS